jgi:hypothetical protein
LFMLMLSTLVLLPLDSDGSEEVLPILLLWEARLSDDARRCGSPTLSAAWRLVIIGVVEVEVDARSSFSEKLPCLRRALFIGGKTNAKVQHAKFRTRQKQAKRRDETRRDETRRDETRRDET